ncbi:MAG: SpoIIE family protein phosphatase [Flavobacteriales bacterium]|nr:SpoIIE family protein phosphatase [Flavobacteriales bacterium]
MEAFRYKEFIKNTCFFLLLLCGCLLPTEGRAQFHNESILMISNYSPELMQVDSTTGTKSYYPALAQNHSIVQDNRGIMYFGNQEGVLEYDGSRWNKITVGDDYLVKSLARDSSGRVLVGSLSEFGYLKPDEKGDLRYESLLPLLKSEEKDFREVWRIISVKEGAWFQSNERVFFWDGKIIRSWKANTEFHKIYGIKDQVFVYQDTLGLYQLTPNGPALVCGDPMVKQSLEAMVSLDDKRILAVTKTSEFYLIDKSKWTVKPFPCEASGLLKDSRVYNMMLLNDRYISLGTWGDGIVIIDKEGNVLSVLSKKVGLQDGIINGQYLGNNGNLWLALSKGIARIDINSPISVFDDRNGLEGTVQDVTRFRGALYAGTLSGVFRLETAEQQMSGEKQTFSQAHFVPIKELRTECWGMITLNIDGKERMLLAMYDGIYEMDPKGQVHVLNESEPWNFCQSKSDPNRVFVGLNDGISSIYWNGSQWDDEGRIPGVTETVFNISVDNKGNLWLGTMGSGVIRMKDTKPSSVTESEISRFGVKNGLEYTGDPFYIEELNGRMLFGTYSGLFEFNEASEIFTRSETLGMQFFKPLHGDTMGVHRMKMDPLNNMWVVSVYKNKAKIEMGFVIPRDGKNAQWVSGPFKSISKKINHAIYHDPYGVTWIGGEGGLYRFDGKMEKDYHRPYSAFVRKVSLISGGNIFLGANYDEDGHVITQQPEDLVPVLTPDRNSLKFEFSAAQFEQEEGLMFSYKLDGMDSKWSDWVTDPSKEYTYIREGTYTFRVKARNIYEQESAEAVYKFEILPPWYRTTWAYTGYVLAFIAFVYGAVTVSTRSLKSVIRERTAEVVKQKELVEEKNRDILDSIRYAKRIQEAILPPQDWVARNIPDTFILYKPKDIVSGDFYYMRKVTMREAAGDKDVFMIAAVDCTGHGVPGAFMSIVGHNSLNQAISVKGIHRPADVLDYINHFVTESLSQERGESTVRDGMDISLCMLDLKNRRMEFAGAFNPIYIIRNGELLETKGDKHPVGGYVDDMMMHFTNHSFELKKGDCIYIFSDGYADQFGGPEGKKFKYKAFKELLLDIRDRPMPEQGKVLDGVITDWMGDLEQVDDICVIGIRV